jgi:hypothetical protein
MKEWIKENINPPGLDKPNRGSLFALIAGVFGQVKDDADKAFNAYFPYLSDKQKLAEHGKSLFIPKFENDSEQEYRERVASASFYLSRAGERGYIIEQLTTHFGLDNYVVWEEFLHIFIKVLNADSIDRSWVYTLLDQLVNPVVALSIIDWLSFVEEVLFSEQSQTGLCKRESDIYPAGLRCNGRILCDQGREIICNGTWVCDGTVECKHIISGVGTVFDYVLMEEYCNGSRRCDGFVGCSGYSTLHTNDPIILPLLNSYGSNDGVEVGLSTTLEDRAKVKVYCDGRWLCDGSNQQPVVDIIDMPISINTEQNDYANIEDGGQFAKIERKEEDNVDIYNDLCAIGTAVNVIIEEKRQVIEESPLVLRIVRHYVCNGRRAVSCAICDGTWGCDGIYTCFDGGWYCRGKAEEEEEVA